METAPLSTSLIRRGGGGVLHNEVQIEIFEHVLVVPVQ